MTPHSAARILVVDDDRSVTKLLKRTLERDGYVTVTTASSATEARDRLEETDYHLVMTDIQMPGGSGLELLESAQALWPGLATIMVTGDGDADLVNRALDLGAYGYVVKPFKQTEVLINVNNALRRRSLELENKEHREHLEDMVKQRTAYLWQAIRKVEHAEEQARGSRSETIRRLATAAEHRDVETGHHVARMSQYCSLLGEAAGLDQNRCEMIRESSQLHDIGKIGIPDSVLLKAKAFTPEERAIMETHASIGHQILDGSKSDVLCLAATIAHTHHEWFDGTGYPNGLKGDQIPLEGRIAAIADVFDALTTHRVYRRAYHFGTAVEMMKLEAGTHFDPEILALFWETIGEVLKVKESYETGLGLSSGA